MVVNDSAACGRQDLSVKRAFIDGSRRPAPCIASGGDGADGALSTTGYDDEKSCTVKQKKKKRRRRRRSQMRV
jgi:hypothetical protein